MTAPKLLPGEVAAWLAEHPLWSAADDTIRRPVTCVTFPEAISLVDRVAAAAEAANHHPDIDIRWRTVHFALTTHDSGGLTALDLELAGVIDRLADEGKGPAA